MFRLEEGGVREERSPLQGLRKSRRNGGQVGSARRKEEGANGGKEIPSGQRKPLGRSARRTARERRSEERESLRDERKRTGTARDEVRKGDERGKEAPFRGEEKVPSSRVQSRLDPVGVNGDVIFLALLTFPDGKGVIFNS